MGRELSQAPDSLQEAASRRGQEIESEQSSRRELADL